MCVCVSVCVCGCGSIFSEQFNWFYALIKIKPLFDTQNFGCHFQHEILNGLNEMGCNFFIGWGVDGVRKKVILFTKGVHIIDKSGIFVTRTTECIWDGNHIGEKDHHFSWNNQTNRWYLIKYANATKYATATKPKCVFFSWYEILWDKFIMWLNKTAKKNLNIFRQVKHH